MELLLPVCCEVLSEQMSTRLALSASVLLARSAGGSEVGMCRLVCYLLAPAVEGVVQSGIGAAVGRASRKLSTMLPLGSFEELPILDFLSFFVHDVPQ